MFSSIHIPTSEQREEINASKRTICHGKNKIIQISILKSHFEEYALLLRYKGRVVQCTLSKYIDTFSFIYPLQWQLICL